MEILEYMARDIEKGYHASGIAKALKLNQKTVSNYLNKLQKQGMLAVKTEGRNKLFYFQRFNIKPILLNIETGKTLRFMRKHTAIEDIMRKLDLKKSMIFGSYAKGTQHKDSDLDIFLVGDYNQKKVKEAEQTYGIDIQIHTTTDKNFKAALKEKAILAGQVVKDHVMTGDYEFFTDHFLKYYYRDFFVSQSHPGRR